MTVRLLVVASATAAIVGCRAGSVMTIGASGSATLEAGAARGNTQGRCYNVPQFRCDTKWQRDAAQAAVVEKHQGGYLFCYHSIELESKATIEIDERKEWGEVNEWLLDVGGIRLRVRQDTDPANMEAHGWLAGEIERVWYPEASGRSARRLIGNTVKREANVVFIDNNDMRPVHFSYMTSADTEDVDYMIDHVHGPWLRGSLSCDAGL